MRVLDDGIAVFSGLARDLLPFADSDILYETTLEVLLEEFPDLLGQVRGLAWDHWGNPD